MILFFKLVGEGLKYRAGSTPRIPPGVTLEMQERKNKIPIYCREFVSGVYGSQRQKLSPSPALRAGHRDTSFPGPSPTPQPSTTGLTISEHSKLGKTLEGGPSLGCEGHGVVPGSLTDMVAFNSLFQVGEFLGEGAFQPLVIHQGVCIGQLSAWRRKAGESEGWALGCIWGLGNETPPSVPCLHLPIATNWPRGKDTQSSVCP